MHGNFFIFNYFNCKNKLIMIYYYNVVQYYNIQHFLIRKYYFGNGLKQLNQKINNIS